MLEKINFCIVILLLIILQQACNSPLDSPYPPLTWERKADFPSGGRAAATAASINGKAYVLFGRDVAGIYQNDCWEYDMIKDEWMQKSSCPGFSRVKAVSVAYQGKIYTGLGYNPREDLEEGALYNDSVYLKDFWEYDPTADSWTRKADAPFLGSNACTAFLYKNEIYVGIGYYNINLGRKWWKYLPEKDEWVQINDFNGRSRFGSVSCTNGERTFFGTGFAVDNLNDWWEYSPSSDSWNERKKLPDKGRSNAIAMSVQNRFFVATGLYFRGTLSGGGVKADILEYNPERNVWYDHGSIPGLARENAITFTIHNKAYIGLGENGSDILSDLLCFEP